MAAGLLAVWGWGGRVPVECASGRSGRVEPVGELALLLFKSERVLEVWGRGGAERPWVRLREFALAPLSGVAGPKLRSGDRQIPEGVYWIKKNVAGGLALDFPNDFDLLLARRDGRAVPAGDVRIGCKAGAACVALEAAALEDLAALIEGVGLARVKVIFAPNDLRRHMAVKRPGANAVWLEQLYARLKLELAEFQS